MLRVLRWEISWYHPGGSQLIAQVFISERDRRAIDRDVTMKAKSE